MNQDYDRYVLALSVLDEKPDAHRILADLFRSGVGNGRVRSVALHTGAAVGHNYLRTLLGKWGPEIPADAAFPLRVDARLLYRAFPPVFLRAGQA